MKTTTLLCLLTAVALSACGQKTEPAAAPAPTAITPAPAPATAPAPAPAAAAAPAATPAQLAIGEKVYTATCAACHATAVMGAPKLGDKAAWGPRIAKGAAALHASALDGLKLMPARGGNPALKDDELKAAVDFMANKAM